MKLIDLSGITLSKGYPGLANNPNVLVGLDFLQQAYRELFAKCAQSVSPTASVTILEGMILSGGAISAGGVYYNGEIFLYNGGSISGVSSPYIACSWIPNPTDTGANQTVLSDGSQVSIHNQRTLTFTYSSIANTGNLPDYNSWVQNQVYINTGAISTLQSQMLTPYAASSRVSSGTLPTSETVIHSLVVPQTINNLLVAYSADFSNVGAASDVQVRIYVGGTVSGHTSGMTGTISGGTLIKSAACGTDGLYNNNAGIAAVILANVTAGQAVTATIFAGGSGPVIENNSDLVLSGTYS